MEIDLMEVRDWGKMKETFGYIFWGNKKKQKEEKKRMNNGEDRGFREKENWKKKLKFTESQIDLLLWK